MRCWVVVFAFACSTVGTGPMLSAAPVKPPSKPPAVKPSVAKPPVKADAPKPKAHPPNASKPTKPPGFIAHLDRNTALVARLQPLLPPGMSIDTAAAGFKNQGQFIAALHVARNLSIPFGDLKAALTGHPHESLGQAIQQLKPGVDAKQAERLARFEGKVDIEESKENSNDNHDTVALKSGPFIKKLQANTALVARLTPLLPPGLSLADAAKGFHSEHEFIAALHASRNLNIPFAQIKAEMTGRDHDTLAVAIFEQQPNVDALAEARKAMNQAKTDLQATGGKAAH